MEISTPQKEDFIHDRINQSWKNVPIDENGYAQFPSCVTMDVTNICNYRCITCPQAKQDRTPVFINPELCKQILTDAFNAGAKEVNFSVFGEPLLNNKLVDYIAFAKNIGYEYIFFNTNGYLATLDRMIPLLEAGLDSIKFSINTFKDSYKLFHGAGDFETVYNNLKALAEYKRKNNLNIKILASTVATRDTVLDIKPIQELVDTLADDHLIKNAYNRGGTMNGEDDYITTDVGECALKFPCPQLYTIATVTAEGYLVICCQDFFNQTVMADLNSCSIKDAWNSLPFVNYRKSHSLRCFDGTLCNNCLNSTHDEVTPSIQNVIQPRLNLEKESDLNTRVCSLKDQFTQKHTK